MSRQSSHLGTATLTRDADLAGALSSPFVLPLGTTSPARVSWQCQMGSSTTYATADRPSDLAAMSQLRWHWFEVLGMTTTPPRARGGRVRCGYGMVEASSS